MTNRIKKTNGVAARLQRLSQGIAPFFFLIFISVFLSIASQNFLTMQNILTILLQISVVGIIAVGQTMVMITAGIENDEKTPKRCDFAQGWPSTTPSFGHPSCPGGEGLFSAFFAHFRRFSKNLPL